MDAQGRQGPLAHLHLSQDRPLKLMLLLVARLKRTQSMKDLPV